MKVYGKMILRMSQKYREGRKVGKRPAIVFA
jgi:hypothetical protein